MGRRARSLLTAVSISVACVALAGCVTYLGRAKRAYAQGMYLEVAEDLGRHEEDAPYLAPKEQVDYGIYRGLALVQLGDTANAHRWFSFAESVEKEIPGTTTPEQRLVLTRALADLAQAKAHPPEPPSPSPPSPPAPAGSSAPPASAVAPAPPNSAAPLSPSR